jgi:hypothetical protein
MAKWKGRWGSGMLLRDCYRQRCGRDSGVVGTVVNVQTKLTIPQGYIASRSIPVTPIKFSTKTLSEANMAALSGDNAHGDTTSTHLKKPS